MPSIADFLGARPSPDALKAAGYVGVARYTRNLSVAEWNLYTEAGLSVTLIFESVNQRASQGPAAGRADAIAANAFMDAMGLPRSPAAACYFVGDDPTKAPSSAYPAIAGYFAQVAVVCASNGNRRFGDYGSGAQINATRAVVPQMSLEWPVRPWGLSAHPNLIQEAPATMSTAVGGPPGSVDQDTCVTADWGQWPQPGPVQVTRGAFMSRVAYDVNSGGTWAIEPNGAVYTADGAPYLGGLNQHPEWKAGTGTNLAVGIAPWSNGYVIVTHEDTDGTGDAFRYYRFSGVGPVAGTGPQGPPGVAGPAGPPGPQGPPASSGTLPQTVLDDLDKLAKDAHDS